MAADLLAGDVALITGAARGIGRAIALGMAKEGASLAIGDVDPGGLAETAKALEALGARVYAARLDVADRADCRAFLEAAEAALGPVSVLVNNAGILRGKKIGDPGFLDEWTDVFRVNVDGCANMVAASLDQLRRTQGRIVNISSTSAVLASDSGAAYGASKGAVLQFTRQLAVELGPDKIRVNAIGPGFVLTQISESFNTPASLHDRYRARTPLGKLAEPEDIVGPVIFLASPMSAHVTGTFLPVDGGYIVTSLINPG